MPADGAALVRDRHDCLNLRFPGAKEFQWTLQTPEGLQKFDITGPYESDDGDVLTEWALQGQGVVLKPVFEVADHLRSRVGWCRWRPRRRPCRCRWRC
jgi:DNA-binding transcriptional LysR family regulator